MFANVPLRRLEGEAPVKLDMPRVEHGMLGDAKSTISDQVDTVTEILAEKLVVSLPNLTKHHAKAVKGLVQLSDEPKSKWHTLLNLEIIKVSISLKCVYLTPFRNGTNQRKPRRNLSVHRFCSPRSLDQNSNF